MSRRDEKSLIESPLLRSKSKKNKSGKEENSEAKEDSSNQVLDPNFLRYGRTGRRNTLPTLLIPNEEDTASDGDAKQKREQEIQKHAHDNLPFLDSFIKKKNKLRQSFHGTPSPNKL
jgi:hypothetical protein